MTPREVDDGFDWLTLLTFAEERAGCRSQFMRRLVINRSYYAAFHVTRARLRALGAPHDETRFHGRLWRYCDAHAGTHGVDAHVWQKVAEIGDHLHRERTRADDVDDARWSAGDCARIVADARELVDRVAALPTR